MARLKSSDVWTRYLLNMIKVGSRIRLSDGCRLQALAHTFVRPGPLERTAMAWAFCGLYIDRSASLRAFSNWNICRVDEGIHSLRTLMRTADSCSRLRIVVESCRAEILVRVLIASGHFLRRDFEISFLRSTKADMVIITVKRTTF